MCPCPTGVQECAYKQKDTGKEEGVLIAVLVGYSAYIWCLCACPTGVQECAYKQTDAGKEEGAEFCMDDDALAEQGAPAGRV